MKSYLYVVVFIYIVQELDGENGSFKSSNKNKNITASATQAIETTTTRRPLLQGLRLPCSCFQGQCGCCTGMILERFRQKACLNITYEPDDFSFTAKMTMNGRVLYKNSISGKHPPPICIPVPRFRFITFCVEFSNIYFARRNMHMCIDAEASWQDFTLIEWSFDCIRLGANGVAVVGEEEGGGLPPSITDEEDQTDEDYDDSARNVPFIEHNNLNVSIDNQIPVNVIRLNNSDFLFTFKDDYYSN